MQIYIVHIIPALQLHVINHLNNSIDHGNGADQ